MIGEIRRWLGGRIAQLFLTSALILFVELLLLRWVPASIVYFGFFTNVLLIGSFLGIGVGILLGRRFPTQRAVLFGPVALLTVGLVSLTRFDVVVRPTDELFFGLTEQAGESNYLFVLPLVTLLVAATLAVWLCRWGSSSVRCPRSRPTPPMSPARSSASRCSPCARCCRRHLRSGSLSPAC